MKAIFKQLVVAILTAQASVILRRHKPTVIAITGSVGKTSTKDAVYAAIKNSVSARKSEKSYNSDIGVPLTVLGLPNAWSSPLGWLRNIVDGFFTAFFSSEYPEVLVLETGIDRPDDMTKLTRWLQPDVVVLTRLPSVPVHVEYFSSPTAVVEEKMKLVQKLKPDGTFIYNVDDTIIEEQLENVLQKSIGFGRYLPADFSAGADMVVYADDLPTGMRFSLEHANKKYSVDIAGTVGTQHVYSCSAAIAVAVTIGIPVKTALDSLQTLQTPPGRMRLIPGIKASVIIDDTYNSSPIAVEQAIQAMKELSYAKRKIAVLGDMLELGKFSSAEHKQVGALVPGVFDILFTVGIRSRQTAEAALATGMSEKNIFQFEDVARAGRELQALIQPGDMILVKGSQGVRAERIVEEVMAQPELATKQLVRQGQTWKNIA